METQNGSLAGQSHGYSSIPSFQLDLHDKRCREKELQTADCSPYLSLTSHLSEHIPYVVDALSTAPLVDSMMSVQTAVKWNTMQKGFPGSDSPGPDTCIYTPQSTFKLTIYGVCGKSTPCFPSNQRFAFSHHCIESTPQSEHQSRIRLTEAKNPISSVRQSISYVMASQICGCHLFLLSFDCLDSSIQSVPRLLLKASCGGC